MKKMVLMVVGLLVLSVVVVLNLDGNLTGRYLDVSSCIDSDGGKNPEKAGAVEVKATRPSMKLLTYSDKCTNKKTLIEYYCKKKSSSSEKQNLRTESIPCRDDCKEGACTPLYK